MSIFWCFWLLFPFHFLRDNVFVLGFLLFYTDLWPKGTHLSHTTTLKASVHLYCLHYCQYTTNRFRLWRQEVSYPVTLQSMISLTMLESDWLLTCSRHLALQHWYNVQHPVKQIKILENSRTVFASVGSRGVQIRSESDRISEQKYSFRIESDW